MAVMHVTAGFTQINLVQLRVPSVQLDTAAIVTQSTARSHVAQAVRQHVLSARRVGSADIKTKRVR